MGLDVVGIVVKDVEKSKKFYENFGLSFKSFGDGNDHWEAEISPGLRLALDSEDLIKKINPNFVAGAGSRIVLAFSQKKTAEVDDLYNRLIKLNYEGVKEPWDAFWGQRYSSILDPDGNQVDIYCPL